MSGRDLLSSVAAGAALVALVASCKGDGFAYQTTYTFNTRLASALYADKESGAWVDRRRVEYRYDEDGHLVGVTREEHIDGVWRATGSAELEWNDDGHLARVVKLRFLGERTGGEEWSFAYDERGNLVREDKRVRLDSKLESTWIDAGTFENRYDGDDRLEERVGYAPSGEDAAPAEVLRVTFARGSDGALEEEIDRIREASSWIDDVRYTLSYDAGAIDAVITHHVHEEAWVAGNKFAFRFDERDKLLEIAGWHRRADTGEWVEDERYVYEHDESADPIRVTDYLMRDGSLVEEQRVTYENQEAPTVLPFNYARTRMHGLRNHNLMKFLFVQSM